MAVGLTGEMSMSYWMVRLLGDERDLDLLADHVKSQRLRVSREADGFFLRAAAFDGLTDPQDVRATAAEWVKRLSGGAALALRWPSSLGIQEARHVADDGRQHIYMLMEERVLLRMTDSMVMTDANGNTVVYHPADRITEWLETAEESEAVAKVLRLLGLQRDWVNLYRILEVIEHDLGGRAALNAAGWTSDREIRRFTHTANSVVAAGDAARHGKELTVPPARPMSLAEAASFIEFLAARWLDEK